MWCLDLRKEYRLMVRQIRVLKKILGLKMDEKTRKWRGIRRRLIILIIYEIRQRNSGMVTIYGQAAYKSN
jgi:hypothetical protein